MSVVRRSPAQWRELVASWQLSGSTLTDFCAANGLNPETFIRRRGQVSRPAAPTRLTLVPVAVAPTAGFATLELVFSEGVTLRVPHGSDPAWAASLIRQIVGR